MTKTFPYQKLKDDLKDNLIGVYEYELLNGVTWIIVVQSVDFISLKSFGIKWHQWPFMLFTKADLESGNDVFPLQYLYIKNHQTPLLGPDLWTELPLDKKDVRLKLEYELRNKLIALREEFLKTGESKAFLGCIIPNFVIFLEALFYLKDLEPRRDFPHDLSTIEKTYDLDLSAFGELWAWHLQDKKIHRKEITSMIQMVYEQLNSLLSVINTLSL
ncbi:MAG TPA: hypothetical protein VIT68_01185 [Candidatus Gracilibacteria bacterium]